MWVYVGDRDHPFNVFDFCRDHSGPRHRRLPERSSTIAAISTPTPSTSTIICSPAGDIIEVGCWTHCRRNFYEAKDSDPARAHLVLARIRQLYEVEADAKKLIAERNRLHGPDADAVRQQLRQERPWR